MTRSMLIGVMTVLNLCCWNFAQDAVEEPAKPAASEPTTAAFRPVAKAPVLESSSATLSGEKMLVKLDHASVVNKNKGLWSARLTPDGKTLLVHRRLEAPKGSSVADNPFGLVKVDIASGKNQTLAVPLTMSDELGFCLSGNPFDAAGGRIVLSGGLDADGDGVFDSRKEDLRAVLLDLAENKAVDTKITGKTVLPMFDRAGKNILLMQTTQDDKGQKGLFLTLPVDTLKPAELGAWACLGAVCPTADIVVLFTMGQGADSTHPTPTLSLMDYSKGKTVKTLYVHTRNNRLPDLRPQWTADGRYLYFVDVAEDKVKGESSLQTGTRIYDAKADKEVAMLADTIPVGPGPGGSSMILANLSREQESPRILLSHAPTAKVWPVEKADARAVSATGKHLVYIKGVDDDNDAYFMAQIDPPKDFPATGPQDK